VHHEEFGDRLLGVMGGYLLYAGLVDQGTHAISIIEKLTGRSIGSVGSTAMNMEMPANSIRNPPM